MTRSTEKPGCTAPHALRGRQPRKRRRRARAGLSLLELLVVVSIIALLISILVVGTNTWRTSMKVKQTRATLDLLEGIVDEYYYVTDGYFDSTFTFGEVSRRKSPPPDELLNSIEDVGDIFKMTGALRTVDEGARYVVVDGWNKPIRFYNPNTGAGPPTERPVFWSFGPDGAPDRGDGAVDAWSESMTYNPNDIVRYDAAIYVCTAAATGTAEAPGNTDFWRLTDDIGTFK